MFDLSTAFGFAMGATGIYFAAEYNGQLEPGWLIGVWILPGAIVAVRILGKAFRG